MRSLTIALLVLLLPSLAEAQYRRGIRKSLYPIIPDDAGAPPVQVFSFGMTSANLNASSARSRYVGVGYMGNSLDMNQQCPCDAGIDPELIGTPRRFGSGCTMPLGGGAYSHSFDNGVTGGTIQLGGGLYYHVFSDGSSDRTINVGGALYNQRLRPGSGP